MNNINLSKLGILGGGQLGRMLAQSAIDYGFKSINILDPNDSAPCNIFKGFTTGSITDFDTVYNFGKLLDIITIEIENVNTNALLKLEEEGKKVYPQPKIIDIIKNKALQKNFYVQNDIPTSSFHIVDSINDIIHYKDKLPLVQKSQTAGYDGKGVFILDTVDDIPNCIQEPCILEEKVDVLKELSIIVVRSHDNKIYTYPITEMYFNKESNLLEYLISPANVNISIQQEIESLASKIASLLKIIGVFAIEFFLTKEGKILVNEIAPRVHNSGHHTKGGFISSQFASHIRAISHLPIAKIRPLYKYSGTINILGPKGFTGTPIYDGVYECLKYHDTNLTIYGKTSTSPYRKLGHISVFNDNYDSFANSIEHILKNTKVTSQ